MSHTQAAGGADFSDFIETIAQETAEGSHLKPWDLVDMGSEFHFTPLQDKQPHINTKNCDCSPEVRGYIHNLENVAHPVYLHHSFDLREIDEWWFLNIQHPELA